MYKAEGESSRWLCKASSEEEMQEAEWKHTQVCSLLPWKDMRLRAGPRHEAS